jgi:hypothetical protein
VAVTTPVSPTPDFISLTNLPGPAANLTLVTGNNQGVAPNTAFAAPLAVRVTDAYGNPIAAASVTFSVGANAETGASAAFASTDTLTVLTNAGGVAIAATLTANGKRGSFAVNVALASDHREVAFDLVVV